MILATFVMFAIGVFLARYMKECLGVDSEGVSAVRSVKSEAAGVVPQWLSCG